jgi:hypothetical protein
MVIKILIRDIWSLPATLTVPEDPHLGARGDFIVLVSFGGIVLSDLVFVHSSERS